MAMCRAACLRPFVSLREFRVAVRRPPTTRPTCRPLAAAATPPLPHPASGTTAVSATAAAGAVSAPTPKYDTLTAEQQAQVDAYLDILLDWNTRMNLTAVRDRSEAYERHVNDSLALLPAIDQCLAQQRAAAAKQQGQAAAKQQGQQAAAQQQQQPSGSGWEQGGSTRQPAKQRPAAADSACAAAAGEQGDGAAAAGARLIDVGSGAGLPGIILAIARPDWEVTLLDSLQKRCKFNEAAIEAAGLSNVRVHWARAEEAGQAPALSQAYDVAIARAAAELRVLAELCLPLVRPGGHWVAAKGAAPQEEVDKAGGAIGKLGGKLVGLQEVDSESPEGRRTAVVVLKSRSTPAQYPRKPGVPGKKPL